MILCAFNNPARQESYLIVVIEKDNMERMKGGDPLTLECASKGGSITKQLRFPSNLNLLIAYEEDDVMLYKLLAEGDGRKIVAYLERNRKFDPKTDGKANTTTWETKL
jgi:hypothetical protein